MAAGPDIRMVPSPQYPTLTAALALSMSLLLLDAAIETFVSGSPVRWWAAGVVAAYIALSSLLWKRKTFTWAATASAAFITLTALLAFTAWLPGGLTDGLRLLGQPTSRVWSLVTSAAI